MLDHNKLKNLYETNFAMVQHHKYSLTEIENMMPWEREVYVGMLINHVQEQNEKIKERTAKRKS
jgi:hypothetical protein